MINILAVEQNQQYASVIYHALSDKSRYHLAVVESGYTALEAIEQKRFDLIIIAKNLSYMDGYKTGTKIRERLGFEVSPFVIAANEFSRDEVEEFLSLGVFDFWEMPVSPQRIRLAADMVGEYWRSGKDNLASYREFLDRNSK